MLNNMDIVPSLEQSDIMNTAGSMIIDACAGSGKTTTAILLALNNPDKNILQITYNSMLKTETRQKIKKYMVGNMKVHTYHSLVTNYYDNKSFDDEHLTKIVKKNYPIRNNNDIFDMIILDEVQDMTMNYYELVRKFIKDSNINESTLKLILLGDERQCIYTFKNASSQFLTLAKKIWNIEFEKKTLSTSYRLTKEISWFINYCMLKENKIKSIKNSKKVDYYIDDVFKIHNKIGPIIKKFINNGEYYCDDFFILLPSINTDNQKAPYKLLENYLVKSGIQCLTPINDDVKLDDSIIKDKVVFTTYHQSKGRERKVVIVYNFDNTYFTYFGKDMDQNVCPNILYVACSRASDYLILIQHEKNEKLKFLNFENPQINKYVNFHKTNKKIKKTQEITKSRFYKKSVTELIKFLTSNTTNHLMGMIEDLFILNKEIKNDVSITSKIETSYNIFEDVSEINGIVIPSIFERKTANMSSMEYFVNERKDDIKQINKYVSKIPNIPCESIEDFLIIGNIYNVLQSGLHSKIANIQKYDWLNNDQINECLDNIDFLSNKSLTFEHTLTNNDDGKESSFVYNHEHFGEIHICGRIDAFDEENIYEFKCVSNLTFEHKLQLIFYYWIWINSENKNKYGDLDALLINIRTGETLKLKKNIYVINMIIESIIMDKFTNINELNDDEFINNIKKLNNYAPDNCSS